MRDNGDYVYTRDYVADRLRHQGLSRLADLALRELPEQVGVEQLEDWAMRYGVTTDGLISRMGGSP